MKLKRLLYLILGCICLGIGCIGVVLPILPTVPFFLVTLFCFAKSSQRLHTWFIGTDMYKKHLESFVKKEGMTVKTKAMIMVSVTLLMGFGFFMMLRKGIYIPCIILGVVWICHVVYFVFGVRTIKSNNSTVDMR
ncbi:MAG: YbaN family protein [Oscillospiraceae bacterium]|nr:YbaN family protein [Oscillospiraceae bacterium]